jgi:pentatricopeptide repeat protein
MHFDTKESAGKIISSLLNNGQTREALAIQREMVDERRRLDETTAALELVSGTKHSRKKVKKEEHVISSKILQKRNEREQIANRGYFLIAYDPFYLHKSISNHRGSVMGPTGAGKSTVSN